MGLCCERSLSAEIPERPSAPLTVAASACLTGSEVRYDGSGAKSSYPHDKLEGLLVLRPVCPEVGIGMGTPRSPIRLVGSTQAPRAVGVRDATEDYTDALEGYAREQLPILRTAGIAGYVFMKNSPSCGLHRVKVYPSGSDMPVRAGRGAYAAELTRRWPQLPAEDCGRLFDPVLCENFVTRVFAYAHWLMLVESGLTAGKLVAFHSRYKYLLMAHSQAHYKSAGRVLADLKGDVETKAEEYITTLMAGLARPATRGGHANVLSHLQGYFKKALTSAARQELAALIDGYQKGEQPLLAVLALLRHHLSNHQDAYVAAQVYLEPTPPRAGLRVPL